MVVDAAGFSLLADDRWSSDEIESLVAEEATRGRFFVGGGGGGGGEDSPTGVSSKSLSWSDLMVGEESRDCTTASFA